MAAKRRTETPGGRTSKRTAKKSSPRPSPESKAARVKATKSPSEPAAPQAKQPRPRARGGGKENHHRRLFALDVYEANKEAIKAPFKALGMKWQYLGPGKGRYARDGVQAFVQFKDEGADYSLWGPDAKAVGEILAAWKPFEGGAAEAAAAATEAETAAAESEAERLWKLSKPIQRPGEPDGFYRRRLAEWETQKPA